jgi:tRNA threonylcarbamoyl adenosine modification protein YeaZ
MRVLAIDTAVSACSVAVIERGRDQPLAAETKMLERGHAEALVPMIERVVARVEGGFATLERVAVTVGPGSFTGLRVGIAAARAVGLAQDIPVVGVSTLAALMAPSVAREKGRVLVAAIDARHGQIFCHALVAGGRALFPPRLAPIKDVVRMLGSGALSLVGSGATRLAAEAWAVGLDAVVVDNATAPDILWVARIGAAADPVSAPPRPLYLRGPDAQPQDHHRLARQ